MANLEAVALMVPPNVQVKGLLDGAALLNVQPAGWAWSPTLQPIQVQRLKITPPFHHSPTFLLPN